MRNSEPRARARATASFSPTDAAHQRYAKHVEDRNLFRLDTANMSEADTRAKLIDPLFIDVLGWHESEIRREKPVSTGYVDYVLGSGYSYLLIEAKRNQPRFQFTAPSKARRLKLDGPHLLGNRKMRPVIEQAQRYAGDLGVQFCAITNGSQFAIFRPYVPGRSWRDGTAITFHDPRDIDENFAEFYALLSRDQVVAGSLTEAFSELENRTASTFTVLDYLPDADRELLRNRIWSKIAKIMGPLLTDTVEDLATEIEVIRHCYVTTPLADQTDKSLDTLLRDVPSSHLTDAAFIDLKTGAEGKTALSHKLRQDIYDTRPGTYILTGGVGSGKTTFLRRFALIIDADFVSEYTAWLHIDFLPTGSVDPGDIGKTLIAYVNGEIRRQIDRDYGSLISETGEQIRELFAPQIEQAQKTTLFEIDPHSAVWTHEVNALIGALYSDDEAYARAALAYLRRRGRRVAVVLDNTDQLGEAFQEHVVLLAQRLSKELDALTIVVLREEKFFAAYRRGIFDAFGDRRFHIGSPSLAQVLKKRLEYGRKKFAHLARSDDGMDAETLQKIDTLLSVLIRSTTGANANIVRMLASVSNGDMRLALDMFRAFLSSGNTNIDKIVDIVEREGGYTVPFHEFAKSAILRTRKYYRSSVSYVVNVFKQSDALMASHMTACRVLARLARAQGAASAHGEGFVSIQLLLREYRDSFGTGEDLIEWGGELLRRDLIEAEPPGAASLQTAEAVRITAAGAYYWKYLVRSFAYIDLVFVDTPLNDEQLARRLATMAELTDLNVRFERVRAFLDYLRVQEARELSQAAARGGPFTEPLSEEIASQIEAEIKVISRKTKVRDEFGA